MESKKDIRKRVLTQRTEMMRKDWEEKSYYIYQKVVTHPFFLRADIVFCYVDYRNEVGTRSIIEKAWKENKKVAIPKVEGDEMSFYFIHSFDDVEEGYKGILEPSSNDNAVPSENSIVIMPGAVFDKNCNRIGYGRGYYDKFLHKYPYCKTLALSFELQIIENVPAEDFDKRPEYVITEETTYEQ